MDLNTNHLERIDNVMEIYDNILGYAIMNDYYDAALILIDEGVDTSDNLQMVINMIDDKITSHIMRIDHYKKIIEYYSDLITTKYLNNRYMKRAIENGNLKRENDIIRFQDNLDKLYKLKLLIDTLPTKFAGKIR